jgi:hypothetical protein
MGWVYGSGCVVVLLLIMLPSDQFRCGQVCLVGREHGWHSFLLVLQTLFESATSSPAGFPPGSKRSGEISQGLCVQGGQPPLCLVHSWRRLKLAPTLSQRLAFTPALLSFGLLCDDARTSRSSCCGSGSGLRQTSGGNASSPRSPCPTRGVVFT